MFTIHVFDEADNSYCLGSFETYEECVECWDDYTTREENEGFDLYFEMRDEAGYALEGCQWK